MQNNGFDLFERGKMYDSAGNEYNITDASYSISADDVPRISVDAVPSMEFNSSKNCSFSADKGTILSKNMYNAVTTCNTLDEYVTKDSLQKTLDELIADVKPIGRKRDIREKIGCLKLKGTGEVSCRI